MPSAERAYCVALMLDRGILRPVLPEIAAERLPSLRGLIATEQDEGIAPDGLRRLTRDLRAVSKSLHYKPTELLDIELPQRKKLKWEPANRAEVGS